jgi:signal transduction histidine kinase
VITQWAPPGQIALAALTALPLALRRRYPVGAYWSVLVTTLAFHFLSYDPDLVTPSGDSTVYTFISCAIAAYSAAVFTPYRRFGTLSLGAGAFLIAVFHNLNVPEVAPGFLPFLVLVPIGLAANTMHTWRQRMRAMEAEQDAATRLAVDKERARIARELHDVVTHNVSMMTVQAGAARTVMATAPDQAHQALLAVEAAGRQAMGELRHVMGLLAMTTSSRDPSTAPGRPAPSAPHPAGDTGLTGLPGHDRSGGLADLRTLGDVGGLGDLGGLTGLGGFGTFDDPAELAPQPGLGQITDLADRVRGTGTPVELVVSGTPVPLPAGVDLAAYRVAQEALTNTVKHASGASVRISVDYLPDQVRIEVADTGGHPSASASTGNGRGLIGLRERLAVYGGTLDAGRRITGGFRVRAVLPVGDM